MRVAIAHDYPTQRGGAEGVVADVITGHIAQFGEPVFIERLQKVVTEAAGLAA